jgi:hypothetical protein
MIWRQAMVKRSTILGLSLGLGLQCLGDPGLLAMEQSNALPPALWSQMPPSLTSDRPALPSAKLSSDLEAAVMNCHKELATYLKKLQPITRNPTNRSLPARITSDPQPALLALKEIRLNLKKIRQALPAQTSPQWRDNVISTLNEMEMTVRKTEERLGDIADNVEGNQYNSTTHQSFDQYLSASKEDLKDKTNVLIKLLNQFKPAPISLPVPTKPPITFPLWIIPIVPGIGLLIWGLTRLGGRSKPKVDPKPKGSKPSLAHLPAEVENTSASTIQPFSKNASSPIEGWEPVLPPPQTALELPGTPPSLSLPPSSEASVSTTTVDGYPLPEWIDAYNQFSGSDIEIIERNAITVGEAADRVVGSASTRSVTHNIIFEQAATDGKYWIIKSHMTHDNEPFDYLVPKRKVRLNIYEQPLLDDYFDLLLDESDSHSDEFGYYVVYPAIVVLLPRQRWDDSETGRWKLVAKGQIVPRRRHEDQ